jgi:NitT/TauT family transport system permease protein
MTLYGYRIPAVFSLLIWAGLWEIVGQLDVVFVFPPLSGVLVALVKVVQQNNFHEAALISLQAFGLGMSIAIVGGILLGILMGRVNAANELLGMWVNIFASAPLSSLVPVLMLLFGLGQTTIIVTVVLFAIWIITLDTYAGINPSLLEMGESFGASRWQLYSKLLIWAALPEILAGIRMGLIRAVKGVVIGQLLVSVIALGQMFSRYSRSFLMEEFWALTLILFAFALGLSALIGMLEQRVEYYAGARA